jgi:putative copper resistance protein D
LPSVNNQRSKAPASASKGTFQIEIFPNCRAAARQFGKISIWNVLLLALAGAELLWLLTEGNWNVLQTAYGQLFVLKLLGFLGLLGLAALNKLALSPALLRNDPKAYGRLHLSISIEMFFALLILVITATLTTVGLE